MSAISLPPGLALQPFTPFTTITPSGDLVYHEKDASVTEEQEPGSHIVIMRCNKTNKVVGVRIEGYALIPEK